MTSGPEIELGYVSGVYGIRGWLKIFSYTDPRDNILRYPFWLLGNRDGRMEQVALEDGGWRGKTLAVKIAEVDTREAAAALIGCSIFVERSNLPELPANEYYWTDLIGLEVLTEDGISLGLVEDMMETGANDVLVVRGEVERLIPFVLEQIVKSVDLEQRRLVVDWEADF